MFSVMYLAWKQATPSEVFSENDLVINFSDLRQKNNPNFYFAALKAENVLPCDFCAKIDFSHIYIHKRSQLEIIR